MESALNTEDILPPEHGLFSFEFPSPSKCQGCSFIRPNTRQLSELSPTLAMMEGLFLLKCFKYWIQGTAMRREREIERLLMFWIGKGAKRPFWMKNKQCMTTSSVPIGDLFELEAASKRICIMHYAVIFAFVLISSEFYIIMWNFTTCFRNSSLIKDNCHYFYLCGFKPFLFIFFLVKQKEKLHAALFRT